MGHFSVKIDFTQFRKYRSVCNCQVKHIGVEHLLFFRIRNNLQFVKARKVLISLAFPPFVKFTQVKLSCLEDVLVHLMSCRKDLGRYQGTSRSARESNSPKALVTQRQ